MQNLRFLASFSTENLLSVIRDQSSKVVQVFRDPYYGVPMFYTNGAAPGLMSARRLNACIFRLYTQ